MKFNYEHEKRIFEKEWMYIEKQCLEIGIAKDEIERVEEIWVNGMKEAAELAVKLEVEAHTGNNWYEAK